MKFKRLYPLRNTSAILTSCRNKKCKFLPGVDFESAYPKQT